MSKLFSDPEYKAMSESEEGWLELAIEPFRFQLNEEIAQLPERTTFEFDYVKEFMLNNYNNDYYNNSVYKSNLIQSMAQRNFGKKFTPNELTTVTGIFKIEVPDGTILDFTDNTLSSPITLIKEKERYDDDEVIELVAKASIRQISIRSYKSGTAYHSATISRMNEIMDLIGAKSHRSSRSVRYKAEEITQVLKLIFTEDQWRLRDSELVMNCGKWVNEYINEGKGHALMNFTRLKCMSHKGNPIYSLEEIT